ncbi:C-Myc-binding protein [Liparis tanakae]|uniref:c-Myc-binding protein n=1 Tax=Liparis tanakae TaxID=230148 RepID=A0A4Z2FR09_9TELE|nr:C-Myc-binding protein [Liparis tanakae]
MTDRTGSACPNYPVKTVQMFFIVALYEETDKPDNALEYPFVTWAAFIKVHLGGAGPEPADAEALRMEMIDLQQKCNLLVGENKELRNRLLQYEPLTEEGSAE